jgi:hypothetical protein
MMADLAAIPGWVWAMWGGIALGSALLAAWLHRD